MKNWCHIMLTGLVLIGLCAPASAGEIEILVNKLVEKGILTPVEAQIIMDETKKEVAKEIAQGKSYALPKWVQNTKVKGDLRLRYQYQRKDNDTDARSRGRLRYRLGIESKVTDDIKVGVGLASGGSDPRSTNQTFQNTFDTPDIRLDKAYAEYTHKGDLGPLDGNLKVIGGKFKRKPYLWAPTDLLWDGDINPEGGSLHYNDRLADNMDGFLNTGVWVIDENGASDSTDPFMHYVQGGVKYKEGDIDAKLAATYYGFNGVKGVALDNSAGTNTTTGGVLQSDYDSFSIGGEVGVKELFGGLAKNIDQRIAVFGEYVQNVDDELVDETSGWASGIKFGHKKVKKPGNWQAKYIFANLGRNAWPDTFPDSDRLDGETNVRSHEAVFQYALKKNVILGIDYYFSDVIKGTKNHQHLLQADMLFKF